MIRDYVAASLLLVVCAASAFAQTEWTLDPGRPVLEPAPPGSWDHGLRFIEAVIEVDGTYHMFYRGQPEGTKWIGPFAIGHATSSDGLSWQLDPANPVLAPGGADDWDHDSIRGAAVIHDGDQFRMWYAANTTDEYGLEETWQGLGYATSSDGSGWEKHTENPIVRPGSPGTFAVPQTVLFDGERYRMWYTASSEWMDGGSTGSSEDGMTWSGFTFADPGPCQMETQEMSVVVDGSRYIMMRSSWGYFPSLSGAVSPNGHHWANFTRQPSFSWAGSPAMLIDDGVFEMWFSSYDGIYRTTSTCCETTYAWFILAAASGAGAASSHFRTEVEINNSGDETAEYTFAWFPRNRDNTEWIRSGRFQIEPGKTARYIDVLSEVFGLGPGSFGAIAVEATSEDVLAVARISISDDQTPSAYGQSVPVVRVDEFCSNNYPGQRILFGAENADERFNVTCFYGRDRSHDPVLFHLFDADGRFLGTEKISVQPFGSYQLNRIFRDHRPVDGYVQVERGWGTYCFGSRLDNRTNDPTTILPQ